MDYRQYLLSTGAIRVGYIAEKMWPNNKKAKSYLSSKLSGKLNWSVADNQKAKKALNDLGRELIKL